mmetsp:Transcript_87886/g.251826  ORF Transcript_87886/g.251826 Transcript_87886/m.251826 type:complete len:296 (-) Transcript_87886:694-1581(-)
MYTEGGVTIGHRAQGVAKSGASDIRDHDSQIEECYAPACSACGHSKTHGIQLSARDLKPSWCSTNARQKVSCHPSQLCIPLGRCQEGERCQMSSNQIPAACRSSDIGVQKRLVLLCWHRAPRFEQRGATQGIRSCRSNACQRLDRLPNHVQCLRSVHITARDFPQRVECHADCDLGALPRPYEHAGRGVQQQRARDVGGHCAAAELEDVLIAKRQATILEEIHQRCSGCNSRSQMVLAGFSRLSITQQHGLAPGFRKLRYRGPCPDHGQQVPARVELTLQHGLEVDHRGAHGQEA